MSRVHHFFLTTFICLYFIALLSFIQRQRYLSTCISGNCLISFLIWSKHTAWPWINIHFSFQCKNLKNYSPDVETLMINVLRNLSTIFLMEKSVCLSQFSLNFLFICLYEYIRFFFVFFFIINLKDYCGKVRDSIVQARID